MFITKCVVQLTGCC